MAQGYKTNKGTKGVTTSEVKTVTQNLDGSVNTNLYTNSAGQLSANISVTNSSSTYGNILLTGTINDLLALQEVLSANCLTSANKLIKALGGLTK